MVGVLLEILLMMVMCSNTITADDDGSLVLAPRPAPLSTQPLREPSADFFNRDAVIREVERIISSFLPFSHLIVVDISCGLNLSARKRFDITFVDVSFTPAYDVDASTQTVVPEAYQKVQSSGASYVALDCLGFYSGSSAYPTRSILKAIGTPRERLACFWLCGPPTNLTSISRTRRWSLTYPDIFVILNKSDEPTYWSAYDLQSRMYLSLLRTHVFTGPAFLRSVRPEAVAQALMHTRRVFRWQVRSMEPGSSTGVVVLDSQDSAANLSVSVQLGTWESSDERPGAHLTAVAWKPLEGTARVPRTMASWIVAQALFAPEVWIPLLLSMVIITVLLHGFLNHNRDIVFYLFGSVWTCVQWPVKRNCVTVKTICVIGVWTLSIQVLSVILRGQIVSVSQSLPESRIKEVSHCRYSYGSGFGTVPASEGVIPRSNFAEFLTQNSHHFLRGGVLCLNSETFDSIRRKIFKNMKIYEVSVRKPQHEVTALYVVGLIFRNGTDQSIVRSNAPDDYPPLKELRAAQFLNSLKVIRSRKRPLGDSAADLREFFRMPLSSTYHKKECSIHDASLVDSTAQSQWYEAINARCVERSDLEEDARETLRLEDLSSAFLTLVGGLMVTLFFFLTATIVRQCF